MNPLATLRRLFRQDQAVIGINRRNVELVYALNRRTDYRFADDKLLTKTILASAGVATPPTLAVIDGLHRVAPVLDAIEGFEQFVVKPASSSGGRGIIVVGDRIGEGRWRRASGSQLDREELRQHVANIVYGSFSNDESDYAYIERRVRAHPMLHALCPSGLSDVRVITLRGQPLMCMLRVPTAQSQGRANLHQGALGLAVDLLTGTTFRALHKGQLVSRHPDSGEPLLGLTLPEWPHILDVARRTAGAVPLGYLGVDIVVDHDATPLVLEINARPGLEIQNVNGRGLVAALAGARALEAS